MTGGRCSAPVLVLAGAASYAGGTLYYKRHFADLPALGVLGAALAICAVMTAVPAALSLPSSAPGALPLVAVAVLGVGCTAGGYLAFYGLIARVGPGRASVITYVAPAIRRPRGRGVPRGAADHGDRRRAAADPRRVVAVDRREPAAPRSPAVRGPAHARHCR